MDFEKIIYLVVGAIIGFALSLAKDWLMESRKDKSKKDIYRKERLEELYVLVGNWSNALMGNSLGLLAVMHGKMHYSDYNNTLIDIGKEIKYDFNRLEMILNVYAPELLNIYNNTIEARGRLNEIAIKHRKAYDYGNTDGMIFVNDYIKAQDNFEKTTKILKENIAKLCT